MLSLITSLLCLPLFATKASAASVFAHFMAQNSYSYDATAWANDINTAQGIKIDGFALNMAGNDYEVSQVNTAYSVAEPINFKFFYSFDMSYSWQQSDMVNIVTAHAKSPSTFLWDGKVLVSTYSGESYGEAFWSGFKSACANAGVQIVLAPAFTSYRDPSLAGSLMSAFPSIDGFFNWWSWPADTGTDLTTDTDVAYQSAVKNSGRGGPYIMAVSPWQFKNLGGDQDWVEYSDTLWNYRWQQAVSLQPDIVEIVTWNDYAESHYIGDINPNVDLGDLAPQYVDGFVHAPWRIVAEYYLQWYKNGRAPNVGEDQVVFWYRAHPKGVSCSTGALPRNAAYPADAIFAMALLSDSATITLDVGSNHYQWNAGPGVSMGSVNFPPEDAQIPYVQIVKNGVTSAFAYGSVYITNACSYYNFNPFVGVVNG